MSNKPPVPLQCQPSESEMRKAYALQPHARRFLLPRETGKPPVDPDAEQLAGQVGALADELARGVA